MALSSSMSKLAQRERTRREILQKSELIPSLPDVVVEVLRLVADKGAEIQQFEDLLKNDGPLVAKMLRVVNSPFYAVASPVRTIGQAVMVLGFRSLRSLVLAASTGNYMERDYRCYGYASKGLWLHSVAVAAASRTIAKELRKHPDVREEVFVAGLLHDIGKLLLAPYLHEEGITIDASHDSAEQERTALGIDHQEAGSLVAEKWGLSPLVHHAISKHHEHTVEGDAAESWAIVRLAHDYARARGIGYAEGTCSELSLTATALSILGIDEDGWKDLEIELEPAVDSAVASLSRIGS
ncbi:MAG: HDOD domain-containing protein [Planctomycetes bacterium]|nr:HDOD domain-containing protein [Planctomycetota bacterium]